MSMSNTNKRVKMTTMAASDVTATQENALGVTGLTEARVHHKPRLLSDNGPCYISKELREWLQDQDMQHTRGAPYHPMTQDKIERYHRSMKNVVKLENYYFPWELENAIAEWVMHYNAEFGYLSNSVGHRGTISLASKNKDIHDSAD